MAEATVTNAKTVTATLTICAVFPCTFTQVLLTQTVAFGVEILFILKS